MLASFPLSFSPLAGTTGLLFFKCIFDSALLTGWAGLGWFGSWEGWLWQPASPLGVSAHSSTGLTKLRQSPHQIKPQRMSGKVGEALLQRERDEVCRAEGQALCPRELVSGGEAVSH